MSLLFNMLYRLVITSLPGSKRLLSSWLQSSSAVILEPRKIKSDTVSTVSPSISHEVMWPDAMIFVFWMLSFKPTFSLSSFTFIGSVMPCNHLVLCHPFVLLPLIFPSIRVFSNESAICIRWPKYWSFSLSPFNEYSGLISFKMDWFGLLAVQGTLKSLPQHYSSKVELQFKLM